MLLRVRDLRTHFKTFLGIVKALDGIDLRKDKGETLGLVRETGCGEKTDSGLSYFGLEVINQMNRVGMMIDLSHCGDGTTREAAEASKDPVLCSHTGVRALNPKCKRLKTDEAIKAIAEKGGIIGISAVPNQLSNAKQQGIQDMLNHIDYVVKLVGVDHVAIGLDNIFGDHVAAHRRMVKEGASGHHTSRHGVKR